MFSIEKNIKIKKISVNKKHVLYQDEENNLFFDGQFIKNDLADFTDIYLSNTFIIAYSNDNHQFIYNKKLKFLYKKSFDFGFGSISNYLDNKNNRIVHLEDGHYAQFNAIKNEVIKEYPSKFNGNYASVYQDERLYFYDHETFIVHAFSVTTDTIIWQIQLNARKVDKILGIVGEKLIVIYEGYMVRYICALNIHTGAMIWHRDAGGLDPHTALIVPQKGTVISLKSRKPNSNTFIEMSLETGETVRVGSLPELEKADLQVVRSVLHGNALYFTANHDGSFGDVAIGVLDFKTLRLQWWEAVEMEQPGSNFFVGAGLVVAGNQLYVQDKTNVLHIYEKKPSFRLKSFKTTALVPIEPEIIYERTPEVIFNKNRDNDLPF